MSLCTPEILSYAAVFYQDIGSPPALSIGYISGWMTSSGNLNGLNTKLDVCAYLTGDGPCIVGVGSAEMDIYEMSFRSSYYESKANDILGGGGALPWTQLAEADTKITRESTANLAKVWLTMAKQVNDTLRVGIHDYKLNRSVPLTVDAEALASYPSPS